MACKPRKKGSPNGRRVSFFRGPRLWANPQFYIIATISSGRPNTARGDPRQVSSECKKSLSQVCAEMEVTIINGALSRDHVHMFAETRPQISVSDFVHRAKDRRCSKSNRSSKTSASATASASVAGVTSPQPLPTSTMTSS